MVELVDSLDSGSSAHSGRGGSTPPSRTIRDRRKPVSFCQSSLDRKAENPWIPCVFRNPGDFLYLLGDCCLIVSVMVYLGLHGRRTGGEEIQRVEMLNDVSFLL